MQNHWLTISLIAGIVSLSLALLMSEALHHGVFESQAYEVSILRSRTGATLVRLDRATGQVWHRRLTSAGPWIEVGSDGEAAAIDAERANVRSLLRPTRGHARSSGASDSR